MVDGCVVERTVLKKGTISEFTWSELIEQMPQGALASLPVMEGKKVAISDILSDDTG